MTRTTFGLSDAELSRVFRTSEVARSALSSIEQSATISRLATLGIQAAATQSLANSPAMKSLTQGFGKTFLDVHAAKFANTGQVTQLATMGVKAAALQSFAHSPAFKNPNQGLGKASSDAHTEQFAKLSFATKLQTEGIGKAVAALAVKNPVLLDGVFARAVLSESHIKALMPNVSVALARVAMTDFSSSFSALALVQASKWATLGAHVRALDVGPTSLERADRLLSADPVTELAISSAAEALRRSDPSLSRHWARRLVVSYFFVLAALWIYQKSLENSAVVEPLTASGLGAPAVAWVAGRIFDLAYPPDE